MLTVVGRPQGVVADSERVSAATEYNAFRNVVALIEADKGVGAIGKAVRGKEQTGAAEPRC